MKKDLIHVGDTVRIRDYYEMMDKLGCDENGNIEFQHYYFTKAMKVLCGETFTVSGINADGIVELKENNEWYFEAGMFEPVEIPIEYEIDNDSFEGILLGGETA